MTTDICFFEAICWVYSAVRLFTIEPYPRLFRKRELRTMTYGFHWETSEAGPIAPPSWVDQVMTFSAAQIPPAKLELGIPGYGYDWVGVSAEIGCERLRYRSSRFWGLY